MPASKDKSKIPKPKSFTAGTPTNSPVAKPRASCIPTPKSTGGSYRAKYSTVAKEERLSEISTKSEPDNRNIKVVLPRQDVEVKESPKGIRGRGTRIPTVPPLERVGIPKLTDHDNAPPIRPCHARGMNNPHIVHKVHSNEKIAQNVCSSHRVCSKEKIAQNIRLFDRVYSKEKIAQNVGPSQRVSSKEEISQKECQSQVEDETESVSVPPVQEEEEASKTKSLEFQTELSPIDVPNGDVEVKETPKGVRARGTRIPTLKPLERVVVAKMTDHDNLPPTMPCLGGEMNNPQIVHKVDSSNKIAQKECQYEVENKTEPVVSSVKEEKASKTKSSEVEPELSSKYNVSIREVGFREGSESKGWISEDYNLEEDYYVAYNDKSTDPGLNIVSMAEFKPKEHKIAYLVVDEDYDRMEKQLQDDDSKLYSDRMTDFTMEDDARDIYEKTSQKGEKEIEPKFAVGDDRSQNNETEDQMNVKQVRISDVLGELENPNHNPIWEEQDFYFDYQESIDDVEQAEEMDNIISDPKLDIKLNVHKNDNIFVVENRIPISERETSLAVNESPEEEIAATFEEIQIKREDQEKDEISSQKVREEKKNNNPVSGQQKTLEVVLLEGNRTLDEIDSTLLKWGYFWTFILMLTGIGLLVLYLSNKLKLLDELFVKYMFESEPTWYESFINWVTSFV